MKSRKPDAALQLTLSDELTSVVEGILARVYPDIRALVPSAALHHIGSTAIPGALTKGDLDILAYVPANDFQRAIEVLRSTARRGREACQHNSEQETSRLLSDCEFTVKQPENWTETFASFGDDTTYPLPVGLQLVVKGSPDDIFLFIQNYLIEHPDALAEYNRLKLAHAAEGRQSYWEAKNRFLNELLKQRQP